MGVALAGYVILADKPHGVEFLSYSLFRVRVPVPARSRRA